MATALVDLSQGTRVAVGGRRAANDEVRQQIYAHLDKEWERARSAGVSVGEVNPTCGMRDNFDFDASSILRGEETIDACGERLFQEMVAVANGKLTCNEILGHREFAIASRSAG